MNKYTREELDKALLLVSSTITNCEKMQPKFAEGTSQHTLLKNRIKALYISKALISKDDIRDKYTKDELIEELAPVSSIISKSEKGIEKFTEGTAHYTRFKNLIETMSISKEFIVDEINRRDWFNEKLI